MILIADAGGSSIKWRLIKPSGEIEQGLTEGYNAYAHKVDKLQNSIQHMMKLLSPPKLKGVFFYGAGISSALNEHIVQTALENLIPAEKYEVNHDLLASARSLLDDKPGIACILGTGSNSCLYDGEEIIENLPSLGYILGDEGSGNSLGKKLIRAYFRGYLPEELSEAFNKKYQITKDELLKRVYSDLEGPGFIAGFTKFLFLNRKHPFIYELIYNEFKVFLEGTIKQYDAESKFIVSFSGSIAFYYSDILRQVGNDLGFAIKTIVEDPIAGLSLFHQRRDL